jgi:hypothetical protein
MGTDAKAEAVTEPGWVRGLAPQSAASQVPAQTSRLGDLAFLIWARDFLSSVAAPATLDTIRVTRAFRAHRAMRAEIEEDKSRNTTDERDLFMSRYGVFIARRVHRLTILALALLWCSLYVSYLVYTGQSLLSENAALRGEIASLDSRLREAGIQEEPQIQAALNAGQIGGNDLLTRPYCNLETPSPSELKLDVVRLSNGATPLAVTAIRSFDGIQRSNLVLLISERQRALCAEVAVLEKRRGELVEAHRRWWEHSILLRRLTQPDEWLTPGSWFASHAAARGEDWHLETFRYRMQQFINGLLAGLMPAMYAALGALASLFRRVAQKGERELLGPADYSGALSSIVLGTLTGAVIGLFANVLPQTGPTVGLPLSTTALALLAGYATDRVFGLFDGLANRVFSEAGASDKRP